MKLRTLVSTALSLVVAGPLLAANLEVSPTSVDFGSVPFGQRKTETIRVTNDGRLTRKVPVKSSSPHVSVNDTSLQVEGKGFKNLIVILSDRAPSGALAATITIDDGKDAIRVNVRANVQPAPTPKPPPTQAATPSLTVSPASLDFGSVELNQSKALTFTVASPEGVPCSVRTDDTQAMVPSPASFSLAPGQPTTITVAFKTRVELQLLGNPKGTLASKATVTCGASKAIVALKGTTPVPRRLKVLVPAFPLGAPNYRGEAPGEPLAATTGGTIFFCDPTDDRFHPPCEREVTAGLRVEVKAQCGGGPNAPKKVKWNLGTGSAASCVGTINPSCAFVLNAETTLTATCVP